MTEQATRMEPSFGYWEATVTISTEGDNGKVKKVKEVHLVDGATVGDVEAKIAEEMKGTLAEWEISSVKRSKIGVAY